MYISWLHPVSYTHLDVYKRQPVDSPYFGADSLKVSGNKKHRSNSKPENKVVEGKSK